VTGWRRDLSTFGLIIAAVLTAAGYAFAFTQFGANLVLSSWALALISAVLYPSVRRFVAAAVIVLFFFYYVGALLAVVFVMYEAVRAAARFAKQ
jgi:hypothetical protein